MMELPKKVSKYISTKKDEDSVAVKTNLIFDLSGLTWKDILEYAIAHLVVKWQDRARRTKGVAIPSGDVTYLVPKPGTRTAEDPGEVAIRVLISKGFTEEQARELVNGEEFLNMVRERQNQR